MAVLERVAVDGLAQGAVPPGYTFTRSTAALYVDSDGLLKWSAHNLLTYSEQFDNAAWANATTTIVVANAAVAPDGTSTADKSTTDATNKLRQQIGVTSGQTYSASVWVKAATSGSATNIRLASNNTLAWSTGASTSVALTSQWQQVSITWTQTGSSQCFVVIGAFQNDGTLDTSCYGDVLVWGAQINYGSTATAYLPTTSAARYDSPRRQWDATNRSWGYVGEGSRTNLLLNTVLAGGASPTSWTVSFGSGAPTTSLYGDADGAIAFSFTSSASRNVFTQGITSSSNTTYTFSVMVEAVTGTVQNQDIITALGLPSGCSITGWRLNGVASSAAASATVGMLDLTIGGTYTGAINTYFRIGCGCVSNATGTVVLSRPQLEAGPAPSSYIPTTTVAVTRGADLLTRALTGPEGTALSTQGTMVVEFSYLGGGSTIDQGSRTALEINNATTAERIRLYNLSGTPTVHVVDGGANQSFQSVTGSPTVNAGVITRVGVSWALNDVSVCVDGSAVATDATATMPTVTTIGIGGYPSSNTQPLFGLIYGWTIYDDAKTDAELRALTTPTTNRNQSRLTLGLGLGL